MPSETKTTSSSSHKPCLQTVKTNNSACKRKRTHAPKDIIRLSLQDETEVSGCLRKCKLNKEAQNLIKSTLLNYLKDLDDLPDMKTPREDIASKIRDHHVTLSLYDRPIAYVVDPKLEFERQVSADPKKPKILSIISSRVDSSFRFTDIIEFEFVRTRPSYKSLRHWIAQCLGKKEWEVDMKKLAHQISIDINVNVNYSMHHVFY